ncbi:hypothetical protein AAFN85_02930 [Mucilaginibacter sp. CAU 1740]|uniref:hypothetical protein n=1 Tax=Mucilaginibacter sp. CAU 1740 TaxID=3140365 RepID=UPI00325C3303
MAIYGVGTKINNRQVRDLMIGGDIIGTGWSISDAADLHEVFRYMNTGDIVFLKSCSYSSDIQVYAIGLVVDNQILSSYHNPLIEIGRRVRWYSLQHFRISKPSDTKFNVRGNTVYQEFHPTVNAAIMAELSLFIGPL